jgi:transcription initiation factor TFIIB
MQASATCYLCKGNVLITDPQSGEMICGNCGLVISDKAEQTTYERQAYSLEELHQRSRTGTPTSLALYNVGLSTVIGRSNKDASGRKLNAYGPANLNRLRMWDSRVHDVNDKNLRQVLVELDHYKDVMGLSDTVTEKSAYLYRKAAKRNLVKGRSVSSILAAALYMACREMEAPRSLSEIATVCDVKKKQLAHNYRLLVKELDPKIPLVNPVRCITMIANRMNLSEKAKRQAINIMHHIMKNEVSAGKTPMGLAATVIYLACLNSKENVTQKELAGKAGVTEVTIRNHYKQLKSFLKSKEFAGMADLCIFAAVIAMHGISSLEYLVVPHIFFN